MPDPNDAPLRPNPNDVLALLATRKLSLQYFSYPGVVRGETGAWHASILDGEMFREEKITSVLVVGTDLNAVLRIILPLFRT
jgi:hypothetical protein